MHAPPPRLWRGLWRGSARNVHQRLWKPPLAKHHGELPPEESGCGVGVGGAKVACAGGRLASAVTRREGQKLGQERPVAEWLGGAVSSS